jgi:hypothetical protein
MPTGIREVTIKKNKSGGYESVRLVFGPHYFLELHSGDDDAVTFVLGATHHGFKADASEVNGELERIIEQVRLSHPRGLVD